MQDRQVAVEDPRDLLGQMSQRIGDAFARAKARQDDQISNGFVFEIFRFEIITQRFKAH